MIEVEINIKNSSGTKIKRINLALKQVTIISLKGHCTQILN